MTENLGKRAQQEREARLREHEEEVRSTISALSANAQTIETNFPIVNDMLRKGKVKKKDNDKKIRIEKYRDEIVESLSRVENYFVELQALDEEKAATIAPHYQPKIPAWKAQLEDVNLRIAQLRKKRLIIKIAIVVLIVIICLFE